MHPMAIIFWYQILFNAILSSFICCTFMEAFVMEALAKISVPDHHPLILPLSITYLHHPPLTVVRTPKLLVQTD